MDLVILQQLPITLDIHCPSLTLISKMQLVPVTVIQNSSILFFAIASAISVHCFSDSICAMTSATFNFRWQSIDCTFSTACRPEVTSKTEVKDASEVSGTLDRRLFLDLART